MHCHYVFTVKRKKDGSIEKFMLLDLGIVLGTPPLMQSDSQSAINMSMDPIAFKNTKHILRAAEFLRDLVHREAVSMQHLPDRVMIADILTKAPARVVFIDLLRLIDAYAQDGIACPA